MRGAFAGVPKGELEAGRAYGMSPLTVFRRIWLPRAIHRALPTLAGETVLQLKATPLVATITVVDVYAIISRVRQDTYLTYEPLLLLLALIYMILTGRTGAGVPLARSQGSGQGRLIGRPNCAGTACFRLAALATGRTAG
jgi:ABC-type arginine/histidine transport system permease subunit